MSDLGLHCLPMSQKWDARNERVNVLQDVGGAMEEGYSQNGQEDAMQTAGQDDDEEIVIIGKIIQALYNLTV